MKSLERLGLRFFNLGAGTEIGCVEKVLQEEGVIIVKIGETGELKEIDLGEQDPFDLQGREIEIGKRCFWMPLG